MRAAHLLHKTVPLKLRIKGFVDAVRSWPSVLGKSALTAANFVKVIFYLVNFSARSKVEHYLSTGDLPSSTHLSHSADCSNGAPSVVDGVSGPGWFDTLKIVFIKPTRNFSSGISAAT